ncbi:hypothetical protein [Terrabacter sp. Ter38]|uniref:hypothetical protein n=1 Tax=Terrabacter sp. Ter38 TaxID=2926030 RepID=UPI002118B9A8|nr:hypothetical protein [Terrabacter sp. Ter38]
MATTDRTNQMNRSTPAAPHVPPTARFTVVSERRGSKEASTAPHLAGATGAVDTP